MDETKTTQEGTPQPTGMSSGSAAGITPPPERSISESQWRSDVKAATNLRKRELEAALAERDSLRETLESTRSRLEAQEERNREAELETVRDNPNLLKLYQDKDALTKRLREHEKKERDLAVREARVASVEAEAQETKKGALLSLVADKVTPDKLERLKGLSLEALEVMADVIGRGPTPTPPGAPEFTPDSAVSSGVPGEITPEWAEKATPEEYAARRRKLSPEKFKP